MQEFARYTARSGSYSYSYILQWELINQNVTSNTSKIRLRALIEVSGASYISWSRGSAVLDGSGFGLANTYNRGTTEVYSKEKTVTHDSQGNGSVYVSGSISTTYLMNGSCGGTISLPKIPRNAKITSHKVSDVKGTSAKVSWTTDKAVNAWQYSLNGAAWKDAGGTVAGDKKSGNYTLTDLKPNTKYTIKTRVKAQDSGLWTESSAATFTTIGALFYYGGKRATAYYGKNGKWNLAIPYIGKNGEWRIGS